MTDLWVRPGLFQVPPGRGRWRFTLHRRQFSQYQTVDDTMLSELMGVRSRRLEQQISSPAQLTFSIDGRAPAAAQVQELTSEVWAWRWDDQTGADVCMFRGPVIQSQDTLSEQANTVNFTCRDYLYMLERRLLTQPLRFDQVDQDLIVEQLVGLAKDVSSSRGQPPTSFVPGSYLPIEVRRCYGNGVDRPPLSGRARDRSYLASQIVGEAISNMSEVIDGFDYDLQPGIQTGANVDRLRIFYPYQGVLRDWPALVYGSTISSLTRSFNSANYANYVRVVGQPERPEHEPGTEQPEEIQRFAEAWNPDSNDVGHIPIGLWMTAASAPDVTEQPTLESIAAGDVDTMGKITPSYSLTMRAGAYSFGNPNLGDEIPLIIHAGRLQVDTYARVLGVTIAIGDDGDETVELTVGRPAITLADLFTKNDATLSALVRR